MAARRSEQLDGTPADFRPDIQPDRPATSATVRAATRPAPGKVSTKRRLDAATKAAGHGWRLVDVAGLFMLADAATGTLVAADWSDPAGGGLTINTIEQIVS